MRHDTSDDFVALGIIRKPHGVHGEASVEVWANDLGRFDDLTDVVLVSPDRETTRSARIATLRPHGGRLLVGFDEVLNPEDVSELRGWTIEIPGENRRELEEDEYWLDDLPGLRVEDPTGRVMGEVAECLEGGGGLLLQVNRPGGGSFHVPFVRSFFPVIDVEGGRMVAELPAGLEFPDEAESTNLTEQRLVAPERIRREVPELIIDVVTIFPEMIKPVLEQGVLARAIEENIVEVRVRDLRDFTTDRHRSTDDAPYGGGAGMVMSAEPLLSGLDSIAADSRTEPRVVHLSPQGRRLDQELVQELAGRPHLVLICGRYEGIDQRVIDSRVDEEISVGDFVVSGGELPAMLLLDAVSRMVPGVVGDRNSVEKDSFYNGLLDHPHYTRPASLAGMDVPEVLLSGHAERIREWRKKESLRATLVKRPDLLDEADLDEEAREMLKALRAEQTEWSER